MAAPPRIFKFVLDRFRQPSGGVQFDPSWIGSSGTTAVSATSPITSTGGATPAIGISPASSSTAGSMSIGDFNKLGAATAVNTPGSIVLRDGSGNIAFGAATGDLTGTASNASNLNNQTPAFYLGRGNHTGVITSAVVSDFDAQVRLSRLDQFAAPTSSVSLNSQKITGLATPTIGSDAVNQTYADGLIDGPAIGSSGAGVSVRGYSPIVTVAASKTLALSDANTTQLCAAAATITIPLNSAVAFPIGTEITIFRSTSGTITLALTGGVAVTDRDGATNTLTTVLNSTLLKKVGTDSWVAVNPIPNSSFLPGDPTTTTQALGTNNTTIATTAHVQAAVAIAGSLVSPTGVTTVDFSIPAGVRRITLLTSSSLTIPTGCLIRLGTSGGIVATGYKSLNIYTGNFTGVGTSSTVGLVVPESEAGNGAGAYITLNRLSTDNWIYAGQCRTEALEVQMASGSVVLSGELTTLRYISSATITAGSLQLLWEY